MLKKSTNYTNNNISHQEPQAQITAKEFWPIDQN
jgi:hypothetical protein